MDQYRTKTLYLLFIMLVVFAIVFFAALYAVGRNAAIINLGGSYQIANWIALVLSMLSIVRIIWEINEVEHPDEHRERMKAMFRQNQ